MVVRKRDNVVPGKVIKSKKPEAQKDDEECDSESETAVNIGRPWHGCSLAVIGKVLLVILVVPPMLNYAGLQREKEYLVGKSDELGVRADIGFGQQVYLQCEGEGKPTVILDTGVGESSVSMISVLSELSSITRVCVYDRAGLGHSQPAPYLNASDPGEAAVLNTLGPESTAVRMVSDLHRLLTISAPQPRPFILLGHELGGLVGRLYSLLHPQDVAHLVMVDPLSETLLEPTHNVHDLEHDHQENPWLGYWFGHLLLTYRLLQVAAMVGLNRLALILGLIKTETETPGSLEDIRHKHYLCDPWSWQAVLGEHMALNKSLIQVKEVSTAYSMLSSVPSTIITGDLHDSRLDQSLNRVWSRATQALIAKLGSRHHVITGADKQTILKQPLLKETLAPVRKIIRDYRHNSDI